MLKLVLIIISLLLIAGCSTGQVVPEVSSSVTSKSESDSTSQGSCYLLVKNKTEFDDDVLSNISIALISQFFREINKIPIEGIQSDACVYEVTFAKTGDTTFLSFTGNSLNSYGDSKMSGADAAQQALLKALYRSQRNKRDIICADYGEYLEECSEVKTSKKESTRNEKKNNLKLEKLFKSTEYTLTVRGILSSEYSALVLDMPLNPKMSAGGFASLGNYLSGNKQVSTSYSQNGLFGLYSFDQLDVDSWGVAGLYGLGNYVAVTGSNSTITASRTNFGGGGGYQWVWENGFNILTAVGLENISYTSINTEYSSTESQLNKDYLEKDLSTRTEQTFYLLFGFHL
jgi:hypothetical protein